MFKGQLRKNIEALDAQIGELSTELEGLKKDTKYDVKMKTLRDLTELRGQLTKGKEDKEKSDTVIQLDKLIEELTTVVSKVESDEAYVEKVKKLEDLTKIRCQLSEAKVKESNVGVIVPAVISGVVGISAILMVLKHEQTEVITSKAFSMATKMFRG